MAGLFVHLVCVEAALKVLVEHEDDHVKNQGH
jgi:hypothetical protein